VDEIFMIYSSLRIRINNQIVYNANAGREYDGCDNKYSWTGRNLVDQTIYLTFKLSVY